MHQDAMLPVPAPPPAAGPGCRSRRDVFPPHSTHNQTALHAPLKGLVDDAVSRGAKVLVGGKAATRGGQFMAPTVLTNVNKSMEIWSEEVFGPVSGGDGDAARRLLLMLQCCWHLLATWLAVAQRLQLFSYSECSRASSPGDSQPASFCIKNSAAAHCSPLLDAAWPMPRSPCPRRS